MIHGHYAHLRWTIVAAGFLQMLVLYGGVSASPRIEISAPSWDFGAVTNGFLLQHNFFISNSGDAPLIINRVLSSCNVCLHPSIEKTNVPPGGGTVVHALLDLRILNGPVTRTLLVYCNDPQTPVSALDLNGDVVPSYQIVPTQPILDLTRGTNVVTAEITPLFQLHAPLSRVECENTNIEAQITPGVDGAYTLSIQTRDSLPKQSFIVAMTVSSGDTNDPVCAVGVSVHNPPDLELIPSQLIFHAQAEEQTQVLWLRQHGAVPLTLLDAVPPSDKFHCEIDPDPNGYDYAIYVAASQLPLTSGQAGSLLLKMMDASHQEKDVKIPIIVGTP